MPRVRKTPTGQSAQPIQAITGQEYGKGKVQEALQKAMPTPQTQPSAPSPNTRSAEPTAPAQSTPRPNLAQITETLKGVGGVLTRPDDQPNVPFTQSLDDPMSRLMAGERQTINRTGEIMRELTRRTGDSLFADLAAKAGL